jgi:hypothetical protein
MLFGEMDDTLMNMFFSYQTDGLFTRAFGYQKWNEMGNPSSVKQIAEQVEHLTSSWNYTPDSGKWNDVMKIYHKLCHQFGEKPADFSN